MEAVLIFSCKHLVWNATLNLKLLMHHNYFKFRKFQWCRFSPPPFTHDKSKKLEHIDSCIPHSRALCGKMGPNTPRILSDFFFATEIGALILSFPFYSIGLFKNTGVSRVSLKINDGRFIFTEDLHRCLRAVMNSVVARARICDEDF